MERPERPSRRSHDKWKRIIEPAGDSDSSEWSSDSDLGMGINPFRPYRRLESLVNRPSPNGNREQLSPVNPTMSSNGQNKQQRDAPSIFQSLESFSFMFNPRYEGLDGVAGTSSNYNHLLHHDYAEREGNNNERCSTNDPIWFHRPMFSSMALTRKRRMANGRGDVGPVSVIDCSTTNTPSTSNSNATNVATSEEVTIPDPDNGNTMNAPSSSNVVINQEDDERWMGRVLADMGRVNSPSRKRPMFRPSNSTSLAPAENSDANETGTALPGFSGGDIPGAIQTQAGQHDCTVTSASMDTLPPPVSPSEYYCPTNWYVQKKLQNYCNKQGRFFHDINMRRLPGEPSSAPEDSSHTAPRSSDDSSEIQVLGMAGPSNGTSRIVYPPGNRRMRVVGTEESVIDDAQGVSGIVEPDDGVEVIMVDDAQPEPIEDKHIVNSYSGGSAQEQQQQKQQQQNQQQQEQQNQQQPSPPQQTHLQQQNREDAYLSPPSSKRAKEDDEILNQGLIGLLECPVCMEYMGPPINQCRRGHLVCSSCKPKLPSCPTCRSRFTESRNLAMEKVADKLHYPCKNAHVGCLDSLRLRDKDEHEANCAFRIYRCIMVPPCEWKGQHDEILPHVVAAHPDALLHGTDHVLEMRLGDLTEQSSHNWVVSALGELFRVNLGAVRGGRVQIFGCVLYLGPARRAPMYEYTLRVDPPKTSDPDKRRVIFMRATQRYVERCSVYYSAGDSFHLRTESAQLFSSGPPNDRTMYVKLHIDKADP